MKYLPIVLTAVLTMFATSIIAEERYLCETTTAGGIGYETTTEEWVGQRFIANAKYIISEPNPEHTWEKSAFVITEVGDNFPSGFCAEPFNSGGYLSCDMIGDFLFNKNTLRFISVYMHGYLDGVENNDNNPHVAIGVCSPF